MEAEMKKFPELTEEVTVKMPVAAYLAAFTSLAVSASNAPREKDAEAFNATANRLFHPFARRGFTPSEFLSHYRSEAHKEATSET